MCSLGMDGLYMWGRTYRFCSCCCCCCSECCCRNILVILLALRDDGGRGRGLKQYKTVSTVSTSCNDVTTMLHYNTPERKNTEVEGGSNRKYSNMISVSVHVTSRMFIACNKKKITMALAMCLFNLASRWVKLGEILTHSHSERPKEAWQIWKYFTYKSIFLKTFEGEMLIRSQTTTLLHKFYGILLCSQVIFISMKVADDTFQRNPECQWVKVYSPSTLWFFLSEQVNHEAHIHFD